MISHLPGSASNLGRPLIVREPSRSAMTGGRIAPDRTRAGKARGQKRRRSMEGVMTRMTKRPILPTVRTS